MKTVSLAIVLLLIYSINIYSSEFDWVKALQPTFPDELTGFSSSDQAYNIAKDNDGNIYVTGYYEGRAKFGQNTISGQGNRDLFIAKQDISGNWLWVVTAGGVTDEYGRDITIDSDGNIYITGYFNQTANFGSHQITSVGNSDIFVAKLSSSGVWQWAVQAGGVGFDRGNGIVTDDDGNIYVIGNFEANSTFGNETLSSSGSRDIFVAKLDSDGDWIWAVKAGGSQADSGNDIGFDGENIVITGSFRSNSNFGDINITGPGNNDLFAAKLDLDGEFLWVAYNSTGTNNEESFAIVALPNGSIAITGSFEGTITLGENNLVSGGNKDIFVAIVDENGDWTAAYKAGGSSTNIGNGIDYDSEGNLIVTGTFMGTASFGSTNLVSAGSRDIFVAKLDDDGTWQWAIRGGGSAGEDSFALVIVDDNAFISGSFFQSASFGSININSAGSADILSAKISSEGTWDWVTPISGLMNYAEAKGVAEDQQGNKYFVGTFYGKIKFGTTSTLTSAGSSDIFVAKLDVFNNWVWAVRAGGTSQIIAADIDINSNNDIFICGHFYETTTIGSTNLSSSGFSDVFIAKLNTNGQWQWAKKGGSTNFDESVSLNVDNNGNAFLIGIYAATVSFDSHTATTKGNTDVFVAKINNSGQWQWVRTGGSSGFEDVNGSAIDNDGNIYVTGSYDGTCQFGTVFLTSIGGDDIFVAKLSASGTWQWATKAGSDAYLERGSGLAIDENSNVYITGAFRGIADFGSIVKVSAGDADIFLAKLSSTGSWDWVKNFGNTGYDEGYELILFENRIIFSGAFSGTVSFGNKSLISAGDRDIFIVETDLNGNVLQAYSAGGEYLDYVEKIIVDKYNRRILVGSYSGQISFENLSLAQPSALDINMYFAAYGIPYPPANWSFTPHLGQKSTVIIPANINPKINERDIMIGDAIALFYQRNSNFFSAGYGVWNGNDLTITVWGDNPQTITKDGYIADEAYKFKTWNVLTGEEEFVSVVFESGPETFQNNAVSVVLEFPTISTIDFTINLTPGWKLISSIAIPDEPLMDDIFADISSKIAIVKDGSNFFIPGFFNSIGDWNIHKGYSVYVIENADLTITGMPVNPAEETISLASGWSVIPYLRNSPMNIDTALDAIKDKIGIVKDDVGNFYIPGFINNIGNMIPGKAYLIYMNQAVGLTYPGN